ncbi:SRPBCC family protein [Pontibacter sp. Tf4]|uniref:SRPBCC family protein n=1 Tax=Pontibacter sp. Tf4 TaxID=2761620 RepID=UPI0016256394|nr:SRPBCC family protein [Pontibacter sp. Tf4]MBB6610779.1 SRPBCC family protein [Pontibacter sp. Tf4]
MTNQKLHIQTALQILKPAHEVFQAIVDPAKMSNYFISEGSGPMEEGKTVTWKFPEFDGSFPVRAGKVEQDKYISYYWDGTDGTELLVEITLTPKGENATVVTITEKEMDNNEEGLAWLMGNTAGWANFLACLKAYLEHGINLRKGAFDFMKPDQL